MRLLTAALMLTATTALSDEVWSTATDDIIYLSDMGDTAILTQKRGEMAFNYYVAGLAGALDSRAIHQGYWIGTGDGSCEAALTGPDGTSSTAWGRITVAFDQGSFPSGFTMLIGECLDDPGSDMIRAEPVVGQ
jgi:hypothetical protein